MKIVATKDYPCEIRLRQTAPCFLRCCLDHSSAAATFWINDGSNWYNAGSFQTLANQWYHLAGAYDGDSLILYVNGNREKINVIGSKTINTNNNYLRFGADGHGHFFNGRIDEVRA